MIVRRESLIAKLAMLVPTRWFFIESVRVGQDYTTFMRIGRKP